MKKLLILTLLVTAPVTAGEYAVQLEASKNPDLSRYQTLHEYGNLYTISADNGYIRTRLGPYKNKSTALEILEKVHAAGFNDAYVAKKQNAASTVSKTSISSSMRRSENSIESFDVTTIEGWETLTPEQQANVVYLDGTLHVKSGELFTPVTEVISNK